MSCYLCAYQRTEQTERSLPLPDGSLAASSGPIGTCARCSVWACSMHGVRYAKFECAMCTPATAVVATMTTPQPEAVERSPAASLTYQFGRRLPRPVIQRTGAAVDRIREDQFRAREISSIEPRDPRPNLVMDLATVIEEYARGPRFLRTEDDARGGEILSTEAIAAAVRDQFADLELQDITYPTTVAVAGAMMLATGVANRDFEGDRHWLQQPVDSDFAPPWAARHPKLLDPVMWLIGTAYYVSS
jgi:hypothetical protein